MTDKLVFVTVGTTKFDLLVSTVTNIDTLNALKEKGYTKISIQIGNGSIIPKEEFAREANIELSYFRFKPSIKEEISKADLIIGHAGAGTCLEVLEKKKPLIVVVNEELMHNHQTELADELSRKGYLLACTCASLITTIKKFDLMKLRKMPPAEPKILVTFLDKFMGFQD